MRFGILGFGIFAEKRLIPGFKQSKGTIEAITKRDDEQARIKAKMHDIPAYYHDTIDLLEDADIEAIFIATPNNLHMQNVIDAARRGKHVICEKPAGMNTREVLLMKEACEKHGVKFMIAQCYRYAGSSMKIRELIENNTLGEIKYLHANFSFKAITSSRGWIFNKKIAGGGPIFDIGVHMVDLARFLLSPAQLHKFKGFSTRFNEKKHPERSVEASGSLMLEFDNNTNASIHCSFVLPYLTSLDILGTNKRLIARYFTLVENDATLQLHSVQDFSRPEKVITVNNGNFYAREIDHFIKHVENNDVEASFPGMDDAIINQIVIDNWLEEADVSMEELRKKYR